MEPSADESARWAMEPIHAELPAIQEYNKALWRFLLEELGSDATFDEAGMTKALQLGVEFNTSIWPHYRPDVWELVLADREGVLDQKIAELNARWEGSNYGV